MLRATVNYLVIPIFTSGVKDGVKNANLKKKMLIFNTIFDPTGKNGGDQIIYSHFKNVCMGKISLQKNIYHLGC